MSAGEPGRTDGGHVLDRLFETVESRRGAAPETSWTARLLAGGVPAAAQKTGEEAVETILAATAGDADALAAESADLLYHLLVLWAACGIAPDRVWRELERREGTSGVAEKAARNAGADETEGGRPDGR